MDSGWLDLLREENYFSVSFESENIKDKYFTRFQGSWL